MSRASDFNDKAIVRFNLREALPAWWLAQHSLKRDFTGESLVQAVTTTQLSLGLKADGMLGEGTLNAILALSASKTTGAWVTPSGAVKSNLQGVGRLISYGESGGLDLHTWRNYNAGWFKARKPKSLVVHWGGFDPVNLHKVFSTAERKVSSHAGLGLVQGEPIVHQYLSFEHKAWHAGDINRLALGIDICQSPDVAHLKRYLDLGYKVRVIDNTSGRGPSKCLSLEPRIVELTGAVIADICRVSNIPLVKCDTHAVIGYESFSGVLGHHHVSDKKWDIAPWYNEVLEVALSIGNRNLNS